MADESVIEKYSRVPEAVSFAMESHIRYFSFHLQGLPEPYSSQDTNRMTIVYFCVSALDLLKSLECVPKQSVIEWVYSMQVIPDSTNPEENWWNCGFRGGPFLGVRTHPDSESFTLRPFDHGHITMAYTGLCILNILGDDLSRVQKSSLLRAMKQLQRENGTFTPVPFGGEQDMRFLYCAVAVCYMLNDWSGIDLEAAERYILNSLTYDGGFGLSPGEESHGGSTYCAVASLKLMNRLDALSQEEKSRLIEWCLQRQCGGFQGRCNKPADTCYSFWIGSCLQILDAIQFVDVLYLREFHAMCQSSRGGFSKIPDMHPDPLHSYLSLSALSIFGDESLLPLNASLGLTERTVMSLMEKRG